MRTLTHIGLQAKAVLLIVYLSILFPLKEGLDHTYGESMIWFVVVSPPAYFVACRVDEWYRRRAVKRYNQQLEKGMPW